MEATAGAAPWGPIKQEAQEKAGCNIETEGCAADPEHGSNQCGCTVNASWGVEVEVNVSFKCRIKPTRVDIQVQIWVVENGEYVSIFLKGKTFKWKANDGWGARDGEGCTAEKWYRAWVYFRTWAFKTFIWSKAFVLPHNQQCYVQEDMIPPGESGVEGDETPPVL